MPDVLILAVGLGSGCPLPVLGALAGVIWAPAPLVAPVLAFGIALSVRRMPRDSTGDDESTFLRAVSTELQAGSTLRTAMIAAADRVPGLELADWARRAAAGQPLGELGEQLGERLPTAGRTTAAAIAVASDSGGASSAVFAVLAQTAEEALAVQRERSVATAQVRLSASIVAGAPVPVLGWLAARGTFGELLAMPVGRLVLAVGLGLEVAGLVATVIMLRSAVDPEDHLVLFGDLTLLGLLAGMPFIQAAGAAAAHLDAPAAAEVGSLMRSARRNGVEAALRSHRGSLEDLLRLAARATSTGAPLASAVAGFTSEAREVQRARALVDARRLSVRLLFPLAFLILPGFIVLVAGPVVLDGVGRLLL